MDRRKLADEVLAAAAAAQPDEEGWEPVDALLRCRRGTAGAVPITLVRGAARSAAAWQPAESDGWAPEAFPLPPGPVVAVGVGLRQEAPVWRGLPVVPEVQAPSASSADAAVHGRREAAGSAAMPEDGTASPPASSLRRPRARSPSREQRRREQAAAVRQRPAQHRSRHMTKTPPRACPARPCPHWVPGARDQTRPAACRLHRRRSSWSESSCPVLQVQEACRESRGL